MRLLVEKTEVRYLKPGDLFSDKPPEWWQTTNLKYRTVTIVISQPEPDDTDNVYRITIEDDEEPEMNPMKPPGA